MDTIISLRQKAKALEPSLRIGKKGLTDEQVKELLKLMTRRELVKVKLLRSALSGTGRKEIAQDLATRAGVTLVEETGLTITFYRKLEKRQPPNAIHRGPAPGSYRRKLYKASKRGRS